jgi:hypothetical protein
LLLWLKIETFFSAASEGSNICLYEKRKRNCYQLLYYANGVHVWQSAMTLDTSIYAPLRQPAHWNCKTSWQHPGKMMGLNRMTARIHFWKNEWANSSYVHQARKKLQGMRAC